MRWACEGCGWMNDNGAREECEGCGEPKSTALISRSGALADLEAARAANAALTKELAGLREQLDAAREALAATRLDAEKTYAWRERFEERAIRAEAELRMVGSALARATYIAEHLFQMIDRETWRASGGDDGQGHYEGDYRAEQTRVEIQQLAALAGVGKARPAEPQRSRHPDPTEPRDVQEGRLNPNNEGREPGQPQTGWLATWATDGPHMCPDRAERRRFASEYDALREQPAAGPYKVQRGPVPPKGES